MKRTTILADEQLLIEAKHLAATEGRTLTAIVQDALREYLAKHRQTRRISFAGMGKSGAPLPPDQVDQALIAGLDPASGWSPPRTSKSQPSSKRPGR